MTLAVERPAGQDRVAWYNDPQIRGLVAQVVLAAVVAFVVWFASSNAVENMRRAHIASGFGFLHSQASFDISQRPIEYSPTSSYGRAFLVGLINTLIVGSIGIVFATVVGFLVGVGRLSRNWLLARICTVYVEVIRNIPPLLQLLFWYGAVLKPLPGPRQSIVLGGTVFLNNRGLYFPYFEITAGGMAMMAALVAAVAITVMLVRRAGRIQAATGKRPGVLVPAIGLLIVLPIIAGLASGTRVIVSLPELKGFNLIGGFAIGPEFTALVLGLSLYTAAFIAEIVRGGILAVSRGQGEAARAVGLSERLTLRLVVVPQAMRVIIPPLANQYLNLVKNSSLAVAIGYPDLVQIFAGTVLNQTGQAIECIAITMAVYLVISLTISSFMNWFNRRVALVER